MTPFTRSSSETALFVTLLLMLSFALGVVGAFYPMLLPGVAALAALALVICFILLGPTRALEYSFFLLLLASTKFRNRDPYLTVSGSIDAQIAFELLCYAFIGTVVVVNLFDGVPGRRKATGCEVLLFLYALFAFSSAGWSVHPSLTAVRGAQQLVLFLFLSTAVRKLGPEKTVWIASSTLVVSVVLFATMASIFPWANGTKSGYLGYARFTWFGVHPITAANECAAALVMVVAAGLFGEGSWQRRLAGLPLWAYILPLIYFLLATGTRASLAAALTTAGGLVAVRHIKRDAFSGPMFTRSARRMLVAAAFIVPALVAVHVLHIGLHEILYRNDSQADLSQLNGRTDLWPAVLRLIAQKPLFGWGFWGTAQLLLAILPWAGETHDALLQSLLDVGMVGSILLWVPVFFTLFGRITSCAQSSGGRSAWYVIAVKAMLVLVLIEGITDEVFVSFVGFDAVLTYACIFAYQFLKSESATDAEASFRSVAPFAKKERRVRLAGPTA